MYASCALSAFLISPYRGDINQQLKVYLVKRYVTIKSNYFSKRKESIEKLWAEGRKRILRMKKKQCNKTFHTILYCQINMDIDTMKNYHYHTQYIDEYF